MVATDLDEQEMLAASYLICSAYYEADNKDCERVPKNWALV